MRYGSVILWIYNNLDQNFKKCSTRKPIALYILKSNSVGWNNENWAWSVMKLFVWNNTELNAILDLI